MNDSEKITLHVKKAIYRNPENSWTVIAARKEDGEDIVGCGILPDVSPDDTLIVTGHMDTHPRYGERFQILSAHFALPNSAEGIYKYLSSGVFRGVGKRFARKIVDAFGADTLRVLNSDGNKLLALREIPRKTIFNLLTKWSEQREMGEIFAALADYQVPLHLAAKIFERYGEESLSIVQRDPYQLPFVIKGLGFLTADKIGLAMGIAETSELRLRGAITYLLQLNEDKGHCYYTTEQILAVAEKELRLERTKLEENFQAALRKSAQENQIVSEKLEDGQAIHYRMPTFVAETSVAQTVNTMLATPPSLPLSFKEKLRETISASTPSSEQASALQNVLQNRVSILTGGSGTGKTTTVRLVITLAKSLKWKFALCAPTGRAACRLAELSGEEAKTIHRLLEWRPHGFVHNAGNPLEADLVVIDEASMLDINLAHAVITSLGKDTRLLLVGDVNQLPAVGTGNFLRDLLAVSRLPAVRLTQIHRQGQTSQIVFNAHLLIQGKSEGFTKGRDFLLIEEENPSTIIAEIKKCMSMYPRAQILAPIYRGALGIDALNIEIKRWFHKDDLDTARDFQEGDKVIQTTNNYTLSVYNGDIGNVVGSNKKEVIVDFAGKKVMYDSRHRAELKLAYVISVHKSQGSEFPVVIMPLVRQYWAILHRNLVYTAITRAQEKMIVIGSAKIFKASGKKNYALLRQTRLAYRLNENAAC